MLKSQIGGLALNHQKWYEMGPESSPGLENWPPGMPRQLPSLWDWFRGQTLSKMVNNLFVCGLALGSFGGRIRLADRNEGSGGRARPARSGTAQPLADTARHGLARNIPVPISAGLVMKHRN